MAQRFGRAEVGESNEVEDLVAQGTQAAGNRAPATPPPPAPNAGWMAADPAAKKTNTALANASDTAPNKKLGLL